MHFTTLHFPHVLTSLRSYLHPSPQTTKYSVPALPEHLCVTVNSSKVLLPSILGMDTNPFCSRSPPSSIHSHPPGPQTPLTRPQDHSLLRFPVGPRSCTSRTIRYSPKISLVLPLETSQTRSQTCTNLNIKVFQYNEETFLTSPRPHLRRHILQSIPSENIIRPT